MIFPSQIFLFVFLPLLLAVYYLVRRRYRNTVLLLFSYLFYTWGSGQFLFILVGSTIADYYFGLRIDRGRYRKFWLIVPGPMCKY